MFVNSLQVETVKAGEALTSGRSVTEVTMTSGAKHVVIGAVETIAQKIRDSITFHMTHVSQG